MAGYGQFFSMRLIGYAVNFVSAIIPNIPAGLMRNDPLASSGIGCWLVPE
jgi:hypothetical protein